MSPVALHVVPVTFSILPLRPTRMLVIAPHLPARVIDVAYRRIAVPLISLLLVPYCRLGEMVDTQSEYGQQVSARLTVLYRGQKLLLLGAVVPLVGISDLIVPDDAFVGD